MERLADLLRLAGLEGTEAEAYLSLFEADDWLGPTDIAKRVNTSRPNADRVLKSLAQRGYVLTSIDKAPKYRAVDPEHIFSQAQANLETRLRAIQEARMRVAVLHTTRRAPESEKVFQRYITGRAEAMVHFQRLIRDARSSIRAILTRPEPASGTNAPAGIVNDLIRRASEGLRLQAIGTFDRYANQRYSRLIELPNVQLRSLTTPAPIGLIVIDDCEVMIWTLIDPSDSPLASGDVVAHTNAPALVRSYVVLFDALWNVAGAESTLGPTPSLPAAERQQDADAANGTG